MNSEVFLQVFSTVCPIFLIAACGFVYGRKLSRKGESLAGLEFANKANIQVFAPALIFDALAYKPLEMSTLGTLVLAGFVIVLGSGLLAMPLVRLMKLDAKTLIPPIMFTNSGNLGIPLILLALGDAMLPAAVLLFIIEMALHMSIGIFYLDSSQRFWHTLKEPMIVAAIAGLLFSSTGMQTPEVLQLPIHMLGQIAVPLMLFSLGVRMSEAGIQFNKVSITGALATPVLGLVCAFGFLALSEFAEWSMPPIQKAAIILFASLPPAVMNYIIAERFQISPNNVAAIVVLGNVAALAVIPLVLFYLYSANFIQ